MLFCNECEYVEVHAFLDYGMLTISIFDVLQEEYESVMTLCQSFDWQAKAFQKALDAADGWLWRRLIGVALADAMADGSRRQVRAIMRVSSCADIENEMRGLEPELDAVLDLDADEAVDLHDSGNGGNLAREIAEDMEELFGEGSE